MPQDMTLSTSIDPSRYRYPVFTLTPLYLFWVRPRSCPATAPCQLITPTIISYYCADMLTILFPTQMLARKQRCESECSIARAHYTPTNSLTHVSSQTDEEIWPPHRREENHTNAEPHALLNAGTNVTLQVLSFPLSWSCSVRRV